MSLQDATLDEPVQRGTAVVFTPRGTVRRALGRPVAADLRRFPLVEGRATLLSATFTGPNDFLFTWAGPQRVFMTKAQGSSPVWTRPLALRGTGAVSGKLVGDTLLLSSPGTLAPIRTDLPVNGQATTPWIQGGAVVLGVNQETGAVQTVNTLQGFPVGTLLSSGQDGAVLGAVAQQAVWSTLETQSPTVEPATLVLGAGGTPVGSTLPPPTRQNHNFPLRVTREGRWVVRAQGQVWTTQPDSPTQAEPLIGLAQQGPDGTWSTVRTFSVPGFTPVDMTQLATLGGGRVAAIVGGTTLGQPSLRIFAASESSALWNLELVRPSAEWKPFGLVAFPGLDLVVFGIAGPEQGKVVGLSASSGETRWSRSFGWAPALTGPLNPPVLGQDADGALILGVNTFLPPMGPEQEYIAVTWDTVQLVPPPPVARESPAFEVMAINPSRGEALWSVWVVGLEGVRLGAGGVWLVGTATSAVQVLSSDGVLGTSPADSDGTATVLVQLSRTPLPTLGVTLADGQAGDTVPVAWPGAVVGVTEVGLGAPEGTLVPGSVIGAAPLTAKIFSAPAGTTLRMPLGTAVRADRILVRN